MRTFNKARLRVERAKKSTLILFHHSLKEIKICTFFSCTQEQQQNPRNSKNLPQEMSDLVVYCIPRTFTPTVLAQIVSETAQDCKMMSSLNESKAKTYMVEHHPQKFQSYHQRQLTRIYPKASRQDSSNFNPIPFWLSGSQMVAMNFQTPQKELQVNQGWFLRNGGCGYVLKPPCLLQKGASIFIDSLQSV